MIDKDFRKIPGYERYVINEVGVVFDTVLKTKLRIDNFGGYLYLSDLKDSKTESLSLHRALALAWIQNTAPEINNVVNHIDGNTLNNSLDNLEWTTYSGNNYHAVEAGLRSDNIECEVRDVFTKEVSEFPSIRQACDFMGYTYVQPHFVLRPKKFGKLLKGRYEFRYKDNPEPWFYEGRDKPLSKSYRFRVLVEYPNGDVREFFTGSELLKAYQLYKTRSKSIPELVKIGSMLYPELKFSCYDSYEISNDPYRVHRKTKLSYRKPVMCMHPKKGTMDFKSIRATARHFNVDASVIELRLDTDIDFEGWLFISL